MMEVSLECDVGTLWKNKAFPHGDRTTLHLHCLDHDVLPTTRDTQGSPTPTQGSLTPRHRSLTLNPGSPSPRSSSRYSRHLNPTRADPAVEDPFLNGMRRDISSLSAFTDGMLVSWGGRTKGESSQHTIVHDTLSPLMKEGRSSHPDFRTSKSISVAVPLVTQKDLQEQNSVHYTLMHTLSRPSIRVQKYLVNMSVSEEKPVVCLVINGGKKVLKMVCYALENYIPVIVVKGSGGIADKICKLGDIESSADSEKELRTKLKGDDPTEVITNKDEDLMLKIHRGFLHRLTFYNPQNPKSKRLIPVILDALLKCKKFQQAATYLQTLQRKFKEREKKPTVTDPSGRAVEEPGQPTEDYQCFVQRQETRVDLLLESLTSQTPSASAVIVRNLKILFHEITFAKLIKLYDNSPRLKFKKTMQVCINDTANEDHATIPRSKSKKILQNCGDNTGSMYIASGDRGALTMNGVEKYRKVRKGLRRYTEHLMATPLSCSCCSTCDKCKDALEGPGTADTCLPPEQELFLWSLFYGNQELSGALMENVPGKIAASLFAFAVYTGMAKSEKNFALQEMLRKKASHFEKLASLCLNNCYQKEETRTTAGELLIKPFKNWDTFSPLQIGILTESMVFVAEEGTKAQLDIIWNGSEVSESGFVKAPLKDKWRGNVSKIFTPARGYYLGLVFQLLFLTLFSYELLFDLQDTPTWGFVLLAIYVADLTADEFRQLFTGSPVLRADCTRSNPKRLLGGFASQSWNVVDMIAIVLFALGMLIFVDNEVAFAFGRVFLSLDALVFFLRFMQMLLYFKNLGIFLVMAEKSMKDTGYFMFILLTVMWGFVVSSNGMLFPPLTNTTLTSAWSYAVGLVFKGLWQVFDLDLDAISVCQEVPQRELKDDECMTESVLATQYGHHVSSVLLALYLLFINVLLMNLLIAKFNHTFLEVYKKAQLHQSWQSCQLILEHYVHTPAPFSVLSLILASIVSLPSTCRGGPRDADDGGGGYSSSAGGVPDKLDMFETQQMLKTLKKSDVRGANHAADTARHVNTVKRQLEEHHSRVQGLDERLQDIDDRQKHMDRRQQEMLQLMQQLLQKVDTSAL